VLLRNIGIILAIALPLLFISFLPQSYAVTTLLDDKFNITSISQPNWSICPPYSWLNPDYTYLSTATKHEGNASIRIKDAGGAELYYPARHNFTVDTDISSGMNISYVTYKSSIWFYDNGVTNVNYDVGIALDADYTCSTTYTYGFLGVVALYDTGSYLYTTNTSYIDSNIVRTIGWHNATHIIQYHNSTQDKITMYLDNQYVMSFNRPTISYMVTKLLSTVYTTGAFYDEYLLTSTENETQTFGTSGIIGGYPNNNNVTVDQRVTYIYVGSTDRSIHINQTYFNVVSYTGALGNAWATVALYSAPNNLPISVTNPLKMVWSQAVVIPLNTSNIEYIFFPDITTDDNSYIAIGLSLTQSMQINGSNTNQTMYYYPTYAPVAVDVLFPINDTLGIYYVWSYITPTINYNPIVTQFSNQWDILNNINALSANLGFPSIMVYGIIFVTVTLITILLISKAKKDSGETGKIPPILLGTTLFGILAFFSLSNMLPFEVLIYAVVAICILFAMTLSKIFLGGE